MRGKSLQKHRKFTFFLFALGAQCSSKTSKDFFFSFWISCEWIFVMFVMHQYTQNSEGWNGTKKNEMRANNFISYISIAHNTSDQRLWLWLWLCLFAHSFISQAKQNGKRKTFNVFYNSFHSKFNIDPEPRPGSGSG